MSSHSLTQLIHYFTQVRYTTSLRRPEDVMHAVAAWSLDFFIPLWDKVFEEKSTVAKVKRQLERMTKVCVCVCLYASVVVRVQCSALRVQLVQMHHRQAWISRTHDTAAAIG